MRPGKSIYYVVIAAALLAFACNKSDTGVTITGNTSSPASTENTAGFPYESPMSVAGESQEQYAAEQPVYEYQDFLVDERGGNGPCIWEFSAHFQQWYNAAVPYMQEEISTCKNLQLKDSSGKTLIRIQLTAEDCHLKIDLKLDHTDSDTTINVCE